MIEKLAEKPTHASLKRLQGIMHSLLRKTPLRRLYDNTSLFEDQTFEKIPF